MNCHLKCYPFRDRDAMTRFNFLPKLLAFLFVTSIITACSELPGGGGIGGSGKIEMVPGSGIVVGQLQSVDNLVIDGRYFDSDQSDIYINGTRAGLNDLRIGMSVTADVHYEQQTANKIEYQPIIAGPIESVSETRDSFVILGQNVLISEDTTLDELTTEDLFEGAVVEVNGDRGASNTVLADYIRAYATDETYYVIGQIDNTPTESESVSISGTVVDLQPLLEESTPETTPELSTGTTIKAEVVESTDPQSEDETLVASSAEVISDITPQQYEIVSVNGVVAQVTADQLFLVRNIVFQTNDETQYQNRHGEEIDPQPITVNRKVSVTGYTLTNGNVLVSRLKIKN